jgi:hypothetical protein
MLYCVAVESVRCYTYCGALTRLTSALAVMCRANLGINDQLLILKIHPTAVQLYRVHVS